MPIYYPIDENTARLAKSMNSYSDYKPGSATAQYQAMVDKAAASDRNMEERQQIQGLLNKIRSTGMGGISSDDANAIEKLREKLAAREQEQAFMKEVNAYYRKNRTLEGCPVLTSEMIVKLQASMGRDWRQDPKPYESFLLSNNNAEIHRLRKRIEEWEQRQTAPAPEGWRFNGGKVVMNRDENRVQIIFDGKPDVTETAEENKDIQESQSEDAAPLSYSQQMM